MSALDRARPWLIAGALAMAVAVAAGAFGAHGLEARLSPEALGWWETGARYHVYHALGLFVVGGLAALGPTGRALRVAGWGLVVGLILFSGSLYLLALTDLRWLGMVTPLGGTSWIIAWIALAMATRQRAVAS